MNTFTPILRRSLTLQILVLVTLLPGISMFPVPLQANPSGAAVVAGGVTFDGLGTSLLNVNQGTNSAIVDWQSFSIQHGEVTNFNMPSVNSVILNRVVTGNPSAIYGALNSNGSVIVVNPNGIVVHAGGVVDVAGMLTLSTLDIANDDFLDGGSNRFQGSSAAGISNYGAISSATSDVVMMGNFLQNAGSVSAPDGAVVFGAGGDMIVEQGFSGSTISVIGAGPGGATGIDNSGAINAAAVELKAHGNVYALGIQNDGVVRANGFKTSGGRVMLSASSSGSVVNTGQIYSRNRDGSGGEISVEGSNVILEAGSLEAAGAPGALGGSVNVVGNNVVVSDATSIDVSGRNGGSVNLGATEMASLNGSVNASSAVGNGGSVDVSGNEVHLGSASVIDVSGEDVGGTVRVGGGYQGNDADIANSQKTTVDEGSMIIADSEDGNGGRVVIWADGDTLYKGSISAQAGGYGNGGFVEVSGKEHLIYDGLVTTASAAGANGTLLLDPADVIIGAAIGGLVTVTNASIVMALAGSNVVIHTSGAGGVGNIQVQSGAPIVYTSANDLNFFAHNDVIVDDDIQNAGTGAISLFAGWDGVSGAANFSGATVPVIAGGNSTAFGITNAVLLSGNTFGDWGTGGGSVIVNRAGVNAVAVGSAGGETNIYGSGISVFGGDVNNALGQIGFRSATGVAAPVAIVGDINVHAKSTISVNARGAATNAGRNNAYAMIGHGGSTQGIPAADRPTNGVTRSGEITVSTEGGAIFVEASGATRGFAQIGHGGRNLAAPGGANGGTGAIGTSGNITVTGGSVSMEVGLAGTDAFAHIGNGGSQNVGVHQGDISVKVTGSIIANGLGSTGGNNAGKYVMIGNGGHRSGVVINTGGVVAVPGVGGNVSVVGTLRDPTSFNSFGASTTMGGHSGSITVEATNGDITFMASGSQQGPAQIGHGGSRAHGNHSFTTTSATGTSGLSVKAGGNILFGRFLRPDTTPANAPGPQTAITGDQSYVQIGLGGYEAAGRMNGHIDVDAGGSFKMVAGSGFSYAQLGNGGVSATNGNNGSLAGGSGASGPTLSQRNAHGTLSGNITLKTGTGGDIELYSGFNDNDAYAKIGHGGTLRVADFTVGGANVTAVNRGHNGDISVDSGGAIVLSAKPEAGGEIDNITGNRNFAMIGHGGFRSTGDHSGKIDVKAATDITLLSGDNGFEGFNPAAASGVGSYNVASARENFAMIGHGGVDSSLHGQIDGFATNSLGYLFNGNPGVGIGNVAGVSSDITVTAGGKLDILGPQAQGLKSSSVFARENSIIPGNQLGAGNIAAPRTLATRSFALIGHGGDGEPDGQRRISPGSVIRGNIKVDVVGPITMTSDLNQQEAAPVFALLGGVEYNASNFTMIGNGGTNVESSFSGTVDVKSGGNIDLQAGNTLRAFSKIGHGGYESGQENNGAGFFGTTMAGNLSVISLGSITLNGGNGLGGGTGGNRDPSQVQFNWAQLGHGTSQNVHSVTADVKVAATNNISLLGGSGWRESYTHIGHGAVANGTGNFVGVIDVTAGDNIVLSNTSGRVEAIGVINATTVSNYAKIGHGDDERGVRTKSQGTWDGDIFVKAGNDLTSTGGTIGHISSLNGDTAARSSTGDTLVAVGRDTAAAGAGILTSSAAAFSGRAAQFSSAALGGGGSELRLYTTNAAGDQVAAGTLLNNKAYSRTPAPGTGSRVDEQVGVEFILGLGAEGEPTGTFGIAANDPGAYPAHVLGPYNLYFSALAPTGGGGGGTGGSIINTLPAPAQIFFNNLFSDAAAEEGTDRTQYLYYSDGYEAYIFGIALDDSVLEDTGDDPVYSNLAEDALDSVFGSRRTSLRWDNFDVLEEEEAEELLRRQRFASNPVGSVSLTFYTFNPATNRFSSYRVFGVPESQIGAGSAE